MASAADLPFVNWENHPVHALDLSPDRRVLAVAHTTDQRVQLFDVTRGDAEPIGHVLVGTDPVSVRFRSDNEVWVVNHISDSISVVDVATRSVRTTLQTDDEPFDVVFANGRAFVSCSQVNSLLVFNLADLSLAPTRVPIRAEDPRALAVSADGRSVYAAIFESGNASTVLGGGLTNNNVALPNVVNDPRGPYAGRNPPPNAGNAFDPPMDPTLTPPRVGLIVRKGADQRWRDDNRSDWTEFVSGSLAGASGRRNGWDLPDHDLAIIDTQSLGVRYVSGLMNIGMAMAVNPASGRVSIVGTDAINEIRFEPKLNSRFVRVLMAQVDPAPGGSKSVLDLNAHLNYTQTHIPQNDRDRSIGDPRALVWSANGQRGWVSGLGSNNVIRVDATGQRVGEPIAVGSGPVALALDEPRARLYAWNHFDASLSVIDTTSSIELGRVAVFNPLPAAIRAGRPLLYDTHRTSGLGQAACASCHVDARMDRLAWDLGDPSGRPARFDQNCGTTLGVAPCADYHAMKGPMTTQTLQDIIGHEPFHWRGDRAGIEAFNPAFEGLLGDDALLNPGEMQAFENFLATIAFPPNPNRKLDNSLPDSLPLPGHYTSGRFAMAGLSLPDGSPTRGLHLYTREVLDAPFQCASCHSLPTGMAVNGPLMLGAINFSAGGSVMPHGPMGENRLGIVSVDGSTNISIKTPHLRNQYEKTGFELGRLDSTAGFGFLHDGSVDSLSRFLSARTFSVESDQEVADLIALMMTFSGSDFPAGSNPTLGAPPPLSRDSHAAVGQQSTLIGTVNARAEALLGLARSGKVGLIARQGVVGYSFERTRDRFLRADGAAEITVDELIASANSATPLTLSVVPSGLERRLGIDRDGDSVSDAVELKQGSNPADAASSALRPAAGLWYNAQRSGHGFDLQLSGPALSVVWYTYESDGTPTWYIASAPYANPWVADLQRFTQNNSGAPVAETRGSLRLNFADARTASFQWQLGARTGSEPMQLLLASTAPAVPDRTGIWYDPLEPGWGLSIHSAGDVRSVVMYFYDADRQPRWVLGVGSNAASASVAMQSYRGFCPDCAVVPITAAAGGEVQLNFDGARRVRISTDTFYAAQPQAHWRRGPLQAVPLSDQYIDPARY